MILARCRGNARMGRLLLALTLSLAAGQSGAQSGKSWMNGIVFGDSDTQGLVGATVELTGNSDAPQVRGVTRHTLSGTDGKYSFDRVAYGDYRFRVSAAGFQTYEIEIYVASDALTALHVRLKRPDRARRP